MIRKMNECREKNFYKVNTGFLLVILLFGILSCQHQRTDNELNIIPKPAYIQKNKGAFQLSKTNTNIFFGDSLCAGSAYLLKEKLCLGFTDDIPGNKHDIIILDIDSSTTEKPEGYELNISDKQIRITGYDTAGVFYGCQTLLQIIPLKYMLDEIDNCKIPHCKIYDYPQFSWRGMHLDVSRHFFPVDSIKKFIDYLSMYKLNTFHWHLTDDQGWRIEIKKYPKLTLQGAWREDRTHLPWRYDIYPVKEGKPKYGGYYSQEEIIEVVDYAREKNINIVPEIDIPGHSWAALYAYPELSCSGQPFFKPPDAPFAFTDPFCAGNEQTYLFLEDVFQEIIELFPSEYIHIGGDEAKKDPWKKCPKCQALMKRKNLADVHHLQSYFIQRIGNFIQSHGRKYIGWDDILKGGLPEGAAIMSWRGEKNGIQAAKAHRNVVIVPSHSLYFNNYQFDPKAEGQAQGHVSTLKKVYEYNPVPDDLKDEEVNYILGVQGCLWTEYVKTWEQVQDRIFPRLLALSEISWTANTEKDFNNFKKRLQRHYHILTLNHINYFIPPPTGLNEKEGFLKGENVVIKLDNPTGTGRIVYTLDGTSPNSNSPAFKDSITITEPSILKAAIFLPDGKKGLVQTTNIQSLETIEPAGLDENNLSPGINYQYLEGSILSLKAIDDLELISRGSIDSIHLDIENRAKDGFGLIFEGFIHIDEKDIYTFATRSDDGSRLYINDLLVVDNDGIHSPIIARDGIVALKEGYYPIKIMFFERNGEEELSVSLKDSKGKRLEVNDMISIRKRKTD
jgi:hexosaminidase